MEKLNGAEVGVEVSKPENSLKEFDAGGLYERHQYTDLQAGEIVMFVPVTVGRARDVGRKCRFFSNVMVARRGVPTQVGFELDADTLEGAIGKWLSTASAEAEKFHKDAETREMRAKLAMPMASHPGGGRMRPAN